MNTRVAKNLLNEAARLMEQTAIFQARYGRGYKMDKSTPIDAWKLYNDIMDTQSIIANLLDPDARADAHHPYGTWWTRQDVMETAMALQLIAEVSHLLASAAYVECAADAGKDNETQLLKVIQRGIAGMLHPDSYRVYADPAQMQAG